MSYQFKFEVLLPFWKELLLGCALSLWLSAIAVVLGFSLGLVTALARRSKSQFLRGAALSYIEVIRNTPFLLQVFFIFFGLPALGLSFLSMVSRDPGAQSQLRSILGRDYPRRHRRYPAWPI